MESLEDRHYQDYDVKKLRSLIIILLVSIAAVTCDKNGADGDETIDPLYRQYMRDFVQTISAYGKGIHPEFLIIPQNGPELLTENGADTGAPAAEYIEAIDGVGREDLYYGYSDDNVATPPSERDYMIAFADIAENNGVEVMVTDYCWTPAFVDNSYVSNTARGYISFAADHRDLDDIPVYPAEPYHVNAADVGTLAAAQNFLYLLDPGAFGSKAEYLDVMMATNYDILLIDLFYAENDSLTFAEISSLKVKANGGSRLVIAYLSIGEAENYRYYWQPGWETDPPAWLAGENPDWPGNYKVRYWDPAWQNIICGNDDSYLKKILNAGFDGAYLDIIDAFEYFE